MKSNERKMQLLLTLEKFDHPASLPQLTEMLGSSYPDRTVRRWLSEYAKFGVVEKIGRKRATKYRLTAKGLYTGAANRFEGQNHQPFSQYAADAVVLFNKPLSKRLKAGYQHNLLELYHPNQSSYFTEQQLTQMASVGDRGKPSDAEGAFAREIQNSLLLEMTYHNSRINDPRISLSEVETLLEHGQQAIEVPDGRNVSILNHFEAMRFLLDNADTIELDVTGICTMHYLLSDALVDSAHAGKVRDRGILNDYTTYIPVEDPKRLQRLLGTVCAKAMHIENPLEQSLFLLIHLTYLQPFIDINRRTARICANIPLIRHNFVPMTFAAVQDQQYNAAVIALLEQQDVNPLTQLYYQAYLSISKQYDQTAKAPEVDNVRLKYRTQIRQLIYQVVAEKITGENILAAVVDFSRVHINPLEQGAFELLMLTEVKQLSPQRIAGTGLSRRQLNDWLALEV